MAAFLVAFPGWKPADYWNLTRREYAALSRAYKAAHNRKK